MRTVAELVLDAEPDAVPRARRLVRGSLSGPAARVVDDAELVVSELVTNATLHGRPPIIVRVLADDAVRIEVADSGRSAPIILQRNAEAMTGRGLSMVAALASEWGVEPSPFGGKVVWAQIDGRNGGLPAGGPADTDLDALLAAWAEEDTTTSRHRVVLGPVATDLLVAAKAQIDNVVRELTLMQRTEGEPLPPAMADLIRSVTVDFADARDEIKRQAARAAANGDPVTHLELHLSTDEAATAERYLAALDQADRYARRAHLLTLASPPVHRLLRQWYVGGVVDQLRAKEAGIPPPPVRSFQLVLAEEVTQLTERASESGRLQLLQQVTSELAAAASVEEMAHCVADHAVEVLGVESVWIRLLGPDRVLRPLTFRGRDDRAPLPAFGDIRPDSDDPAAVAARTGERVYVRSLSQSPLSSRPDEHAQGDNRGHFVPLAVGGEVLGVLGLTFRDGERTDVAEGVIVEALADVLAQALKRAELAARDREQKEALSFLADATRIMITAREPGDVLDELVSLAVPRLGDWCTAYLADGEVLRRVAMATNGLPELPQQFAATTIPVDLDVPHARAFRTGRAELIREGTGEVLEHIYPGLDLSTLRTDPHPATGICVPVVLRGRTIGVIGLTFVGSGRRVTQRVVDTLVGLSARAAIALDNAERWTAQAQMVQTLVQTLLPGQPPVTPGVEFAARYLPAMGEVAGDWWEAEQMPDGTILLGMGDAAGHGIGAVSQMLELRHGARALAAVEPSPLAVLADLDRRLSDPDAGIATAVYGRLDPVTGMLRWANAGHVPPILVSADGQASTLRQGAGTPLGAPGRRHGRDVEVVLEPGDTLLLYTDGVVERRDEVIETGIDHLLQTVASRHGLPLDATAEAIIAAHGRAGRDDCCLLLVRRSSS